jgi:hypothetical protein
MSHPGQVIPADFEGLSFEMAALPELARDADRGDLVALLRSLGPGVLRLGGATADRQVAWVDPAHPRPSWASISISRSEFQGLATLLRRTGWRVLLTVGLAHFDPASAAREVVGARAALGDRLAGVEIGNEPDRYVADGFRPRGWGFAQYVQQVDAYRRAIAADGGASPLVGPDVSSYAPNLGWVPAEAGAEHPALLSAHYYSFNACSRPTPTLSDLTGTAVAAAERSSLSNLAAAARTSAIPLRLDETNNVSCRGEPGVSDTFASALWGTAFLARAMQAGLAGVNLHDLIADPTGYAPLAARSSAALAAGQLTPAPEWYALLFVHPLVGDRPLAASVDSPAADVSVTAALQGSRDVQLLVVDGQAANAGPLNVPIHLARDIARATVMRLTAVSPAATSGVRIAGASVGRDGVLRLPGTLVSVPVAGRTASLTVAPSSAALLTLDLAR